MVALYCSDPTPLLMVDRAISTSSFISSIISAAVKAASLPDDGGVSLIASMTTLIEELMVELLYSLACNTIHYMTHHMTCGTYC